MFICGLDVVFASLEREAQISWKSPVWLETSAELAAFGRLSLVAGGNVWGSFARVLAVDSSFIIF